MEIRKASFKDYDQVWEIFQTVIQTGDTYVFHPDTPKEELQKHWFASYMDTYICDDHGKIVGTYILKPNQIDTGAHIANASYMVHPKHHGKGIGKALCTHSIQEAISKEYLGIQFNLVVSTNTRAVRLWQHFGFNIIGTIPNGFKHKTLGYVDAHIMYLTLVDPLP